MSSVQFRPLEKRRSSIEGEVGGGMAKIFEEMMIPKKKRETWGTHTRDRTSLTSQWRREKMWGNETGIVHKNEWEIILRDILQETENVKQQREHFLSLMTDSPWKSSEQQTNRRMSSHRTRDQGWRTKPFWTWRRMSRGWTEKRAEKEKTTCLLRDQQNTRLTTEPHLFLDSF